MYLTRVEIEGVRAIERLEWEIGRSRAAGWHVIIGDNGSGKSSFLRSVALALVGPDQAAALRENWSHWLRRGAPTGRISLELWPDSDLDPNPMQNSGPTRAGVVLEGSEEWDTSIRPSATLNGEPPWHLWKERRGWFSASFGPYRRFEGGDQQYEKLFRSRPRLSPHVTIFGEAVALSEAIGWLQELKYQRLEDRESGGLLDPLVELINQDGFLPHGCRLEEISSEGVVFCDGQGNSVPVGELSDGYRSILSLTFELIRQMSRTYGASCLIRVLEGGTIDLPGVVLIDEVDAHLHPTWQRNVGPWFRRCFPCLQFIVTTHSPLVCQAAEHGSVMRLPKPGDPGEPELLSGIELNRLVYGDVLDAYDTGAFGAGVTRSESSKERLHRLARLNRKQTQGTLSADELADQTNLRALMPTASPSPQV